MVKISKTKHVTKTGVVKRNPTKRKSLGIDEFYIVESQEANREIFKDLEKATKFAEGDLDDTLSIIVGKVYTAFKEDGEWNYDDEFGTYDFDTERTIKTYRVID